MLEATRFVVGTLGLVVVAMEKFPLVAEDVLADKVTFPGGRNGGCPRPAITGGRIAPVAPVVKEVVVVAKEVVSVVMRSPPPSCDWLLPGNIGAFIFAVARLLPRGLTIFPANEVKINHAPDFSSVSTRLLCCSISNKLRAKLTCRNNEASADRQTAVGEQFFRLRHNRKHLQKNSAVLLELWISFQCLIFISFNRAQNKQSCFLVFYRLTLPSDSRRTRLGSARVAFTPKAF